MPEPSPASLPPASREQSIGRGVAETSRWTLRLLIIVGGLVLLGAVVAVTWSILLPVALAVLLCTALHPVSRLLQSVGLPRAAGAGGAVVVAIAVAAGLVAVVAPTVAPQVVQLGDSASESLDRLREFLRSSPLAVSDQSFDQVVRQAQQRLESSADMIASRLVTAFAALTNALVNLVLTLVLTFMFLKDGHRFLPWLRGAAGPVAGSHLTEVLGRVWHTISGFVRAQALVGLLDALFIGAGLLLMSVPLALPLALLTFVAAFVPVVGAVAVGALAVLVALVSEGPVIALAVFVLVLVVQQLEGNVFLPWLQGRSLGLHAAVVLLAIVLGSTLFGVTGAFLGVPVAASAAVVLSYLSEQAGRGRQSQVSQAGETDEQQGPRPSDAPSDEAPSDDVSSIESV